jgi:tRNA threonylcarbamoyladenosine biosynthesis protein TsaE
MQRAVTHSAEETQELGRRVAEQLLPGEVLALIGDLGSGKTCFVKGLASGLGIDPATVTSPSFVLVHEYTGGRLPLYHIDLYRIAGRESALELGLEEYLEGPGISAVEWADRIDWLLPESSITVRFRWLKGTDREIEFASTDERWAMLLDGREE